MVQFGKQLQVARLACGLTQDALARQLRVSKGYISRLEAGKTRPAERVVIGLADACGIDSGEMLILAGYPPKDLQEILKNNPVIAPKILRETFGPDQKQINDSPHIVEPIQLYQRDCPVKGGSYELFHANCFEWMERRAHNSIHAIVTDPPYGLKEYTSEEKAKLRRGRGGVWRKPPAMDGCIRRPLPRFTILSNDEKQLLTEFFRQWGSRAIRILVPGGHVFVATNPLLSHLVYLALLECGFEKRGEIIRLVQTLRGGDRPKNAHNEYNDVTVMPRSGWEPWGLFRKPCIGRVQDNLRQWYAGGLRRNSPDQPFCDVIRSAPTRSFEREIAPHPSLKPQAFMRHIVRASLPLGKGVVLDPFMGGGSTIAAAVAVGYESIGIESDAEFFHLAEKAIPSLSCLIVDGEAKIRTLRNHRTNPSVQTTLFD